MKITLLATGKTLNATLVENPTTKDFKALLPLTFTMSDLFKREKYTHLASISEDGERTHTYKIGDIAYWSPSYDLATYYREDGEKIPAPGLIHLGKVDSVIEAFDVPGRIKVKIELSD